MKTVNEYKKIPSSELGSELNNDVDDAMSTAYIEARDKSGLKRGNNSWENLYNTTLFHRLGNAQVIGQLQALLTVAILDLQDAEAEINALKQAEFHR